MNQKLRTIILILLILATALILRLWKLGSYPALNADEASIGYDAYSLINTGMDQHGNRWPIHFQSFNDYKPGLVVYLVLPFVKVFGLNTWSVRIPGALFGAATVYVIYLLAQELFRETQEKVNNMSLSRMPDNQRTALVAAFLLTISPWHIHFSRGMWEVNVATFLMCLGTLLFVKSIKNKSLMFLSFITFILSLYTYHSTRVIAPLLVVGLFVIYRKILYENIKNVLVVGIVASLFLIPLIFDLSKGTVLSRAAGVGLFADKGAIERINEQRGEHNNFNSLLALAIHNKPVNYGLEFLENWTQHFHGLFLFVSGDDIQRNKVPETGEMLMFDIVWLMIGLWFLAKKVKTKGVQIILLFLIIAPIAAALTFQAPHALRAQVMVVPLVIISAFGLSKLITLLSVLYKNSKILNTFYLMIIILILWQFARYEHMYWVHMAKEYPFSSQYGLEELSSYLSENDQYDKVLITDTFDQPYILLLFYTKYSPQTFQKEHVLSIPDKYGFSTVRNYDKYEFRKINWDEDNVTYKNSLIVGTPDEIPNAANVVEKIYGSNGYEYFDVVAN